MAPRANWKGFLKLAELSCPVALYTAASTSERIAFNTINRETGNRVQRQFVDAETGKPVPAEEQVKGYEVAQDQYVILTPEEIAATVPESDKTLTIGTFVPCDEIDDVYFDKPYYLAPSGAAADDAFTLLRDAMRKKKVAALARAVLFRRVRTVLIRPYEDGMMATTLNFDYEVRAAKDAFDEIPDIKIEGEMLDLAKHIIKTKSGTFDPKQFDDRYESALADLVRAKREGREIERPKPQPSAKVIDLMEALRQSAGVKPAARAAGRKTQTAEPNGGKTAAKKKSASHAAKPAARTAAAGGRRRKQA
jgi:DNA end-binding protein Ku